SSATGKSDDLRGGKGLRNIVGRRIAWPIAARRIVVRRIAARRKRPYLDAWILRESSGDEKRFFGLDRALLDTQAAPRNDAVSRKKDADARRNVIQIRREKRCRIFFAKVAMQVDIGSERFDEQLAGGVVDEERQVQSFICNPLPFLLLAIALLPCGGAVEKARLAGDGRGYGVGTTSRAGDLDQSQGGAANLGGRSGKQQALAGKQVKPGKEKVQATGNRDQGKNREEVDRDEEGKADSHGAFLDCLG